MVVTSVIIIMVVGPSTPDLRPWTLSDGGLLTVELNGQRVIVVPVVGT